MVITNKKVDYLVVDTTAFIKNASLQDIADHVVTAQEVIHEITSKRQLRRLVVLPYELVIKDVFPENIVAVTEFAKKTGDYLNLSPTDIKILALTYQLEKEHVGTEHIRKEPIMKNTVNIISKPKSENINSNLTGFFMPKSKKEENVLRATSLYQKNDNENNQLVNEIDSLNLEENSNLPSELKATENKILQKPEDLSDCFSEGSDYSNESEEDEDDGWITSANVREAKQQINDDNVEEKFVKVACITTDFAMQNVLKQMNLNVSALDGRIIKHIKTYILRCFACFKTTSIMTKTFCPNCGNNTLKRVSVSVDADGKQKIHINARHSLTARGKKFSLPTVQGGKHSKNPILAPDQPMPDQRPTRLARMKNNPFSDDYIAGYSPFVMRDVNSKSAQLGIRSVKEVKHWMRKNPNEAHRRKK